MIGSLIAAFVGGYAVRAGLEHRRHQKDAEVLLYLAERGPSFGRDIRDGLRINPWFGSPYPRLRHLEKIGLVVSTEVDCDGCDEWVAYGHTKRRKYALTGTGFAALKVEAAWGGSKTEGES